MSIKQLPPEAIAQIKSSTTITSLNGVICELVKNSLDSGCTKVDVLVDYVNGGCVVEDNGFGIPPAEFREEGGLGRLHHTSRLHSKTPVHGARGCFLASLSSMALLSVTSHHNDYHSHNTITMHKAAIVNRQNPAPAHQALKFVDHGTRITVRDLFGNMPVRVKQRAITADKAHGTSRLWEELRNIIISLLLSWPFDMAMTIQEAGSLQRLVIRPPGREKPSPKHNHRINVPGICHILSQASIIALDSASSWLGVSVSADQLQIDGAISLEPAASKHIQFISFGIEPVAFGQGHNILFDEVNRLFLNSSFGDEEVGETDEDEKLRRSGDRRYKSDGYTNRELKATRKAVDRWPMFYINIQSKTRFTSAEKLDVEDILSNKQNSLTSILDLLRAMIEAFLIKHDFRLKYNRKVRFSHELTRKTPDSIKGSSGLTREGDVQPRGQNHSSYMKPKNLIATNADLLGTNIKLPSFRHPSPNLQSPFDSWSKVKRGSSYSGKTPRRPVDETMVTTSSSECTAHTPLLSSGKVIRRPFPERETIATGSLPSHVGFLSKAPNEIDGAQTVEWMDPNTKNKISVDTRTGHSIVSRQRQSTIGSSLTPGSRSRLSLSQSKPVRNSTGNNLNPDSTDWVSNLMKTWENPVYAAAEATIPEASISDFDESTRRMLHGHKHVCSQVDVERAFKDSSKISGKISKHSLKQATIISQIDRKFILVKLCVAEKSNDGLSKDGNESLLVIIDQHAADERIRIENLMGELCNPSAGSSESPIDTMSLEKPIIFEVPARESQLLRIHRNHFSNWGILFDTVDVGTNTNSVVSHQPSHRIEVRSLPPTIAERCKSEPRLLTSLIRTEAHKCAESPPPLYSEDTPTSWIHHIHHCPQGLLDMLNSRACRSAIMFNDPLSIEQCKKLVKRLADCHFPFQCAHGRPCLVPLVELGGFRGMGRDEREGMEGSGMGFAEGMRDWKRKIENGR
ncbi:ATPase of HSP90 chaperone/DNA topoisomerase II/histidine kinase [Glarea lozoyensis ATCC 20868]|uniref:ATPase of HSP90 chaperone/DNA topoisomerase II/histidine kinase n=1 Tax=Glarea lozoyensis (strain ATCC 20868 / MF5171) TaxID=1116229 RepID=S3D8I7_GLAL2|nr:ATPase of HSP90 chaperone/DNA topoisomerase II/histidine kinase [Glarea lozoyensis ATCC 20868]EPE34777.1 ATPase of HSP90 chaperone/DNA topoisomerase II/histidine kinase [Glarea lozoyensis ATCC 20868]